MKKVVFLTSILLFLQQSYSQLSKYTWTENFDGMVSFTSSPSTAWSANTSYSVSFPNSWWGEVPQVRGDSTLLTTPIYDLETPPCGYAYLRFSHICKVSPRDTAYIEYRTNEKGSIGLASWTRIPSIYYRGSAKNYEIGRRGFNADSYTEWQANDSMAIPAPSWWKDEFFELSNLISFVQVQFRFVIKRGYTYGSNYSYGWLLDNFELLAATHDVYPPTVEFISPFIKDTVNSTGPWDISAKVKTNTGAPIVPPYLKWTINNGATYDSTQMTMIMGDSLWKGTIPQFIAGTNVKYTVIGKDTNGNDAAASSAYYIEMNCGSGVGSCKDTNSVALIGIISPDQTTVVGGQTTPVEVIIRNRGVGTLTTCLIEWKLNGIQQQPIPYTWSGSLPWDFQTKVSIGTYIPRMQLYDTIVVWVSMPNGVQDPVISDDTQTAIMFGRPGFLQGEYTVGIGKDFPDIGDAIKMLSLCGVSGDIRLKLASSTYTQAWNFTNQAWNNIDFSVMGGYMLTITSETGNRNDVIVRPSSGVVVTLNNIRNLTLEAITFGRSSATAQCVQFTGPCTNIVIRNCNILADTTVTSTNYYDPIYKTANSGILDSFRLVGCFVEGGYYNFSMNSTIGGNQYARNVAFDSNTFKSGYHSALYPYNTYFTSISHNTLLNRVSNNTNTWYGINLSMDTQVEEVIGNRIIMRQGTTAYTVGIGIRLNRSGGAPYLRTKPIVVANNEIIGISTSTTESYGIYLNSFGAAGDPPIYLLHNSIYYSGGGSARGIYPYIVPAGQKIVMKNNLLHVTGSAAYPIYLYVPFSTMIYDIDYNIMYNTSNPLNVGYSGGALTSIGAWQNVVTTDKNSVNIAPSYVDVATLKNHLKLTNYSDFYCLQDARVREDIEASSRGGITTMGCYTSMATQTDAMLMNLQGMKINGGSPAIRDTLKVEIYNAGMLPIDTATICWNVNGVSSSILWTGYLLPGDKALVPLNAFSYQMGNNTAAAYICGLGSKTDGNRSNDTAKTVGHVCVTSMSGTYYIPRDYANIATFAAVLDTCGAAGPITLHFVGQYTSTPVNFSTIAAQLRGIDLIITGDTIYAATGNAVNLGSNQNITFKNITLQCAATSSAYCIQFLQTCTNITIRNCNFLSNPTATGSTIAGIYKASGTGFLDNITITNNNLDGGYYNIYLHCGMSQSNSYFYGNNIMVDSNILTNSYYHGIDLQYNFGDISYNKISSRPTASYSQWVAIYPYFSNAHIIGNRILGQASNITSGYGVQLYYPNHFNRIAPVYIANNEIRFINNASGRGIAEGGSLGTSTYDTLYPINIVNNSIYTQGQVGISASTSNYYNIKNNNIHIIAPIDVYPITFTFNAARQDIDANNMYAPYYVGQPRSGVNAATIAEWQSVVSTDSRSTSVLPDYVDINKGLETKNWADILCPQFPGINTDIDGNPRWANTFMGAYSLPMTFDLNCVSIVNVSPTGVQDQAIDAKVNVLSTGNTVIQSAVFGWSRNGIVQNSVPWTFTPNLTVPNLAEVPFASFNVQNSTEEIKVWIEQINGVNNNNIINDTVSFTLKKVVLAKFLAPILDTLIDQAFDVLAEIRTETGAPVNPPILTLVSSINSSDTLYDNIPMTLNSGVWKAYVPQRYYGSNVVYSLSVTDAMGNTDIIKDSVFIKFFPQKFDTLYVGTGSGRIDYLPFNSFSNNSWSRQMYLSREIGNEKEGVYITDFAWEFYYDYLTPYILSEYGRRITNQTCYFQIVDGTDSVLFPKHIQYILPPSTDVTMVWQNPGTYSPTTRFNPRMTLITPFYLPAGKNLIIQWDDHKNVCDDDAESNAAEYYYSSLPEYRASYANYGNTALQTSGQYRFTRNRVNAQFYTHKESGTYPFANLAIVKMLSLEEDKSLLCGSAIIPIEVVIENRGNMDINFMNSNLHLYVETTTPIIYKADTLLRNGILRIGESMKVKITSAMPIMTSGVYDFKIWLESPIDLLLNDNTLQEEYTPSQALLPIDEYFNPPTLSSDFKSEGMNSSAKWEVIQGKGTGRDSVVVSQQGGTGMLRFMGGVGAVSVLYTKQIGLYGTNQPMLSFWYFHDTAACGDYTNVLISLNGWQSEQLLLSINKQHTAYGWKRYDIDLSAFTSEACVILLFEAVSMSNNNTAQYIDRINISAYQNFGLDTILISPLAICDYNNKDIQVVIANFSAQQIDFSKTPTRINLRINMQDFVYLLNNKKMMPLSRDTITITTLNFSTGTHLLTASILDPIDRDPSNDTVRRTLTISPDITIEPIANTSEENCLPINTTEMTQMITVSNIGNFDLSDIPLILNVWSKNAIVQTLYDTLKGGLLIDSSKTFTFAKKYTVPHDEIYYNISVSAELACDVNLNNNTNITVMECLAMEDVALIAWVNPMDGIIDDIGSEIYLEVTIENYNPFISYPTVRVTAIISDGVNEVRLTEDIVNLGRGTKNCRFATPYIVPNSLEYTIKVFINNIDNYPYNDTITSIRQTNFGADIVLIELVNPAEKIVDMVDDVIYLEMVIENKSPFKIYDRVVVHAVISDGINSNIELSETLTDFAPGTRNCIFTSPYIVPSVQDYTIKIFVDSIDIYPDNDTITIDRQTNLKEDIAVIALVNPPAGSLDNVGEAIHLEVTIKNQSIDKTYPDIFITAFISDGENMDIVLSGHIANFTPGARNCRFANSYTVPAVSDYTITVFVNNVDLFLSNDTIIEKRQTNLRINNDYDNTTFSLGQNIPNPAKENTRIDYNLPEDGQVLFTVYTITGQRLYVEKNEAYSGRNEIEFSTAKLADGVYYYSMEYKGERLVKRMTIRK